VHTDPSQHLSLKGRKERIRHDFPFVLQVAAGLALAVVVIGSGSLGVVVGTPLIGVVRSLGVVVGTPLFGVVNGSGT
jgi:hypothetical protein